jgi:hypothetical protein
VWAAAARLAARARGLTAAPPLSAEAEAAAAAWAAWYTAWSAQRAGKTAPPEPTAYVPRHAAPDAGAGYLPRHAVHEPRALTRTSRQLPRLSSTTWTLFSVGAIAVTAVALRVWRLTAVGFRGDESVYAGQAGLLAGVDGMSRWFIAASRGNSNFLVYQWLVSLTYRVVGISELSARLTSAVFSTLTVLLVYVLARQIYGRREAGWAALVLAISGYAVSLGRLALLDATACFFVTAALCCLAQWQRSGSWRWLALMTAATALAMQAKVTTVLVIPVVCLVLVVSRDWRRLSAQHVVGALLVGAAALVPAAVQLFSNKGGLLTFLHSSTQRASAVPWHYYLKVLWSAEGAVMCGVLLFGVGAAVVWRTPANLIPLVWLAVFALFLQAYPLKAFNYLLPVIPGLALLAGRALAVGLQRLSRRWSWRPALWVTTGAAVVALCAAQVIPDRQVVLDGSSAGMREAAHWLQSQNAARAGAMTLSHGSGQYVLSLYGGIDAYPFGRFRIATVLPGGEVVQTSSQGGDNGKVGGGLPTDWVDDWPARLIEEGKVSYLVYKTRPLDDPPEQNQIAGTITERQFRSLIQQYGGQLVHTVYWHHEARVYIYRVTKRLAAPQVDVESVGGRVKVHASGFVMNSPLTLTYHGDVVARTTADQAGSASVEIPTPDPGQSEYHLSVSDAEGDAASVTGLPSAKLLYTVDRGVVRLFGIDFQPRSVVSVSYGNEPLGIAHTNTSGSFTWTFALPKNTHPRFRIRASDQGGHTASATGLATPSIAFAATGREAVVTGAHYMPGGSVKLTYRGRVLARPRVDRQGAFRVTVQLPSWTRPAYRLLGVDSIGREAYVTGLVRR